MKKVLITALLLLSTNFLLLSQNFIDQASSLDIIGSYGNPTGPGRGGGMSFADFNQDGYADLTFCTEQGKNLLFFVNKINHFELLDPAPVYNIFETKQVLWIDVENDGDKDLFVTAFNGPDILYINDGNFNFTYGNFDFNLPFSFDKSYGANFADINNDGYLDLFISKFSFDFITDGINQLFLFDPDNNSYVDITFSSGISNLSTPSFCNAFVDFNFDGYMDIYVANDCIGPGFTNEFYINNGDSSFNEIGGTNGTSLPYTCSMNTGVSDFDQNGYWDIYVTSISNTNSSLLSCDSIGMFTDVAEPEIKTFSRYTWTGNFFDYDNDADEDLYVSASNAENRLPNAMFVNQNAVFTEPLFLTNGLGNSDTISKFANAIGDYNNDGLPDIVSSGNNNFNFTLYTNYENNDNKFIKLKLVGIHSNIDGIGARIEVYNNGNKQIYQKHATNGFLNQNDDLITIGFGNAFNFDSIYIFWPYPNHIEKLYYSPFVNKSIYTVTELLGITDIKNRNLCKQNHQVVINPIPSQTYGSSYYTYSSKAVIDSADVKFKSETIVELLSGFKVEAGSSFTANIGICTN